MKDPNDTKTLDIKDDEVFIEEETFDSYDENGVSPEDFAWYGNDPAILK